MVNFQTFLQYVESQFPKGLDDKVTHATSPPQHVKHKELSPSGVDTGKDTQCLVEEDDSECWTTTAGHTLIQYNSKQASEQETEEEASSGTKKNNCIWCPPLSAAATEWVY